MYAYCNNNPVMYVDPYGESAAALLGGWISTMTPIAFAEPTLIGEAVLLSGIALLLVPVLVEVVVTTISSVVSKAEEAPKSVGKKNKDDKSDAKKQSSPGKMQREVEKGQAPKDVKSVHSPKNGKPHVHFKDGTSINNDGTPHDRGHGTPKLTKDVKKWLEKHNWPTEVVFP